eukprot:59445_1
MAMKSDKAKAKKKRNLKIFVIYGVWNIIRYIIIAIAIFIANTRNVEEINKYKKYCCPCYYVSQDPSTYNVKNLRFDLSFCIPECTDCNYCETFFDTPQAAFDYEGPICPITDYTGGNRKQFNWDWDKETGCNVHNSHVSYTSFEFFAKSYKAYGIWSIVTTGLYSLGLIGIMYYVYTTPSLAMILLRWILIYNILISEIFLYLLFKPFQYHHEELVVGINAKDIVCDVNSISDTAANVISKTIFVSVGLMALHFIYIIYRICGYCYVCIRSHKYSNRMKQNSVDINDMEKQINYGTHNDTWADFSMIKYKCRWDLCGIVVGLLMGFFLGISIYATYKMIEAGHDDLDQGKITIISFVMALIFLSLIDNPWLLIKMRSICCWCCRESKSAENSRLMLHSL